MPFPFALVSQGIGLAASLMGGGGGMSAQIQLEIVRQLSQVNDTLLAQTKIMKSLVEEIKNLPANQYQFNLQQELATEDEAISDLLLRLRPERGTVANPTGIYEEFTQSYDRLKGLMNKLEALVKTVAAKELTLVSLSYSIISSLNNMLLLTDIVFEPSIMINLANEEKLNIDGQPDLKPHIASEEYQSIRSDLTGFVKTLAGDGHSVFSAYQKNHAKLLAEHSNGSGSLPGDVIVSGSGFRQQRFRAVVWNGAPGTMNGPVFGVDNWVTRSRTITTKITVSDALEEVLQKEEIQSSWLKQTSSGGTAKKIRNNFPKSNLRPTSRRPEKPYDHWVDRKKLLAAYKARKKNPPRTSIFRAGPRFGSTPWGLGLSYYVRQHFSDLRSEDIDFIRKKSDLAHDIRKCEELIAIWIYMEGFELFLLDFIDQNTRVRSEADNDVES